MAAANSNMNTQLPPTKRQRLSLSQSKESVSEEAKGSSGDVAMNANDGGDGIWSEQSIFSAASNSLISDDASSVEQLQKRG